MSAGTGKGTKAIDAGTAQRQGGLVVSARQNNRRRGDLFHDLPRTDGRRTTLASLRGTGARHENEQRAKNKLPQLRHSGSGESAIYHHRVLSSSDSAAADRRRARSGGSLIDGPIISRRCLD